MKTNILSPELLHKIDAFWRVANFLLVGQIYLYDNQSGNQKLEVG